MARQPQPQTTFLKPFGMLWPWHGESIIVLHDGDGRVTAKTRNRDVAVDGRWDGKTLSVTAAIGTYQERGLVDDIAGLLTAFESYEEQGR